MECSFCSEINNKEENKEKEVNLWNYRFKT